MCRLEVYAHVYLYRFLVYVVYILSVGYSVGMGQASSWHGMASTPAGPFSHCLERQDFAYLALPRWRGLQKPFHDGSPTVGHVATLLLGCLKGLCHQIRIAWKWDCFKGLGMDMRCFIFKRFVSEPSNFNRHLKFLCLGSKSVQILHFVSNLDWSCSKCIQIALFAPWNNSDFQCFFSDWLFDFMHFLQSLLYWRPESF
jgi:hypothetical protein